ncbi:MAG: methyltransferase domain-containing protein [Gammaproteobacteria bacterium]|nr:methyltransferase domain-containing protein [Gammaproteobacteria bacterium]
MTPNTFYADHWRDIDDERVARYERMFVWREGHAALLAPLGLRPGSRVLDYGCGPGFVTEGMAEIVGSNGRAYGVDLNASFVANASSRNSESDNISFHLVDGDRIPLDDAAVDRLLCKNVLEYVPDVQTTLAEFRRVLEPGGRLLLIDSDWGFVVVEPWGRDRTRRFFEAAAPAFREPEIGRKLRTHVLNAGFDDVEVRVQAGVDTEGGSLLVLRNMASYASAFDAIATDEVDAMLAEAQAAIDTDRYLFCLPQFVVTGVRTR